MPNYKSPYKEMGISAKVTIGTTPARNSHKDYMKAWRARKKLAQIVTNS